MNVSTSAGPLSFPMLRRSSYRRRLWLLAACVTVFLIIVGAADAIEKAHTPPVPGAERAGLFGLDFIAFYTGGRLVDEGRHRELFDLGVVKKTQDQLAAENGAYLGQALGPWWNPPFYAWVFVPFSRLAFGVASAAWIGLNVACVLIACGLLSRVLPKTSGWRSKLLIPVLAVLSVPFIHTVTHGQNAGTSLLIVTVAALLWRADRPMLAGLVAGLMAYKPQHAVVLGGMMTLSLGWRAFAGLAITGISLLIVTLLTLPGSLGDFLHQMPRNVLFVQEQCVYLWERHATLKAFWRMLLQGREIGPPSAAVTLLTAICTAGLAARLLRMTRLFSRWANPFDRTDHAEPGNRDRLIAATFLATPLLMPFYFDYDLLLMTVPAVLLAGVRLRTGKMIDGGRFDRCVLVLFPLAYACLLVNADVAEASRVNLIVPLLAMLASCAAWPVRTNPPAANMQASSHPRHAVHLPIARAA